MQLDKPKKLPKIDLKKDDAAGSLSGTMSGGGRMGGMIKPLSLSGSKESLGVGGLNMGKGLGLGGGGLDKMDLGKMKLEDNFGEVPAGQKKQLMAPSSRPSGQGDDKADDDSGDDTDDGSDDSAGDDSPSSQPTSAPTSRPSSQPATKILADPLPSGQPKPRPAPRIAPLRSLLQVPKAKTSTLAEVNNEAVKQSDFLWALMLYKNVWEKQNGPILKEQLPLFRKKVLERVIDERLVYQQAKQQGVKLTPADRQRGMQMFRAQLKGQNLGVLLQRAGISNSQFQAILERQLYLEKYKMQLAKGITVTPQQVKEVYKRTVGSASVRARHIVVEIPENASAEVIQKAKKRAEQILALAKSGVDFANLARKYSNDPSASSGGDLGTLRSGDTIKSIEDALFALPKGGIGGLVRTVLGFHILKVEDKRTPKPLAMLKPDIMKSLYQKKIMQQLEKEAQELRKDASIEILVPWGKD